MKRNNIRRSAKGIQKTDGLGVGDHSVTSITLAQALAELFEQELHPTTGTSRHTVESYKTTFRLLLRFLEQHRPELLRSTTPVERIDTSVVEAFLRHLAEKRGCKAATVNVRRAAFATLARSLVRRHPDLSSYSQSLMAIRGRKAPEVHALERLLMMRQHNSDSTESPTSTLQQKWGDSHQAIEWLERL